MAVEQDFNAIAFPTLSEEQLAQLGRYAGERWLYCYPDDAFAEY